VRKGDEVRILGPPSLAGREGIVIEANMGEIGVRFATKDDTISRVYWFLPSQLQYVDRTGK
jgi:hypothetical protein